MHLRPCSKDDLHLIAPLSALLRDAVHGGASVGFLAPLDEGRAGAYWQRVFQAVGEGLHLWVAELDGEVVGTVQLELCTRENGRHRAEVQKLLVLSSQRGRGIAARLMQAAEAQAVAMGRTLLVLDTQSGSKAEAVYRHLGWTVAGQVPEYAASPDGTLQPTTCFYKRLG